MANKAFTWPQINYRTPPFVPPPDEEVMREVQGAGWKPEPPAVPEYDVARAEAAAARKRMSDYVNSPEFRDATTQRKPGFWRSLLAIAGGAAAGAAADPRMGQNPFEFGATVGSIIRDPGYGYRSSQARTKLGGMTAEVEQADAAWKSAQDAMKERRESEKHDADLGLTKAHRSYYETMAQRQQAEARAIEEGKKYGARSAMRKPSTDPQVAINEIESGRFDDVYSITDEETRRRLLDYYGQLAVRKTTDRLTGQDPTTGMLGSYRVDASGNPIDGRQRQLAPAIPGVVAANLGSMMGDRNIDNLRQDATNQLNRARAELTATLGSVSLGRAAMAQKGLVDPEMAADEIVSGRVQVDPSKAGNVAELQEKLNSYRAAKAVAQGVSTTGAVAPATTPRVAAPRTPRRESPPPPPPGGRKQVSDDEARRILKQRFPQWTDAQINAEIDRLR